jgi:hypothetical protein
MPEALTKVIFAAAHLNNFILRMNDPSLPEEETVNNPTEAELIREENAEGPPNESETATEWRDRLAQEIFNTINSRRI